MLDAGLRAYMLRVYNWMSSGLLLTGIVAYAIAHTGAIDAFFPLTADGVRPRGAGANGSRLHRHAVGALWKLRALVLSFGVNRLSTTHGCRRCSGRSAPQWVPA